MRINPFARACATAACVIAVMAGAALGGDISRKGTTGADQLLIPVGARSIATGGAFLSNTHGVEAIYYNPAGLSGLPRTEAMFSYMSYIADINISYFALGFHPGDFGSFGLSFKSFAFDDIPVTTVDNPDGTGATYTPSIFNLGLTYAKTITDQVSAGFTAKLIHEGFFSTVANGFALDFGVQYRFDNQLSLGVAVKNLGGNMKFSGQDLQVRTSVPDALPGTQGNGVFEPVVEPFQVPSYFELSTAYEFKQNGSSNSALLVGATYRNNNSLEDLLMAGAELKAAKNFFLRGGYDYAVQNNSDAQYDWTLGAGLEYEMETFKINVDYAYRNVQDFNANNVFTVRLAF